MAHRTLPVANTHRQVPSKNLPPVPPRPQLMHVEGKRDLKFPDVTSKRQSYPASVHQDSEVIALKKKVAELEKMQEMYKRRIAELETQVSSFSVFHLMNNPAVKNTQGKPVNRSPLQMRKDLPQVPGQSIFYKRMDIVSSPSGADSISNTSQAGIQTEKTSDVQISTKESSASYNNLTKVGSNEINPSREKTKLLALYDYVAPTEIKGRLSFKEGDVMYLISKGAKNGWWVAEFNGIVGKIPSNFVECLDSTMAFSARVVKQFLVQQPGDLEVHRGELVTILKRQENGWYLGEKKGITGFFPSECAERIVGPAPIA